MIETVFHDISFEDYTGNTYEITTTFFEKARYIYNQVKCFNNVVVKKRAITDGKEMAEKFNVELFKNF